ncbi:MAG: protoporphyrinogen oxidase HemJ [Alphaproteobacteria bacterium]|jgi:putative membrane protein|nr:protoporphyrinogen oxidase HemJ [Alphaproteobacteria bacterium]
MNSVRDALAGYSDWIKAFHVIFVITWMAGMLYLPRLFVYHTQTKPGSEGSERFKVMERKLLRGIINPSMIAVWILGPLLAWITGAYMDIWLQIKFALVIVLSGIHGFLARCWKDFAADRNTRSERFYRVLNEIPAVLMIAIVILAVVKPFS